MWMDLQREIIEDFAGHYRGYDRELDRWIWHRERRRAELRRQWRERTPEGDQRRRESRRRWYQKVRQDPERYKRLAQQNLDSKARLMADPAWAAAYQARARARTAAWYRQMRADPAPEGVPGRAAPAEAACEGEEEGRGPMLIGGELADRIWGKGA